MRTRSGGGLLPALFGLEAPVSRRFYATAGVALMATKYAVDASLLYATTGRGWPPLAYLTPLLSVRVDVLGRDAPPWLAAALVLVSLPFLWVGLSMSARRAVDAGRSPSLGLYFLVPLLNYLVLAILCALPSAPPSTRELEAVPAPLLSTAAGRRRGLQVVLICTTAGLAATALSVYGLRSYGVGLFIAAPGLLGALAAYLYNREALGTLWETLGLVLLTTLTTGLALFLLAAEGLLCLFMALHRGRGGDPRGPRGVLHREGRTRGGEHGPGQRRAAAVRSVRRERRDEARSP